MFVVRYGSQAWGTGIFSLSFLRGEMTQIYHRGFLDDVSISFVHVSTSSQQELSSFTPYSTFTQKAHPNDV